MARQKVVEQAVVIERKRFVGAERDMDEQTLASVRSENSAGGKTAPKYLSASRLRIFLEACSIGSGTAQNGAEGARHDLHVLKR